MLIGAKYLLVIIFSGVFPSSLQAASQDTRSDHEKGQAIFNRYCAPCHGSEGIGNGPVAPSLKEKPPDLTRIQKAGEAFPKGQIHDIIDGERVISAHGSRQMPVWGRVLRSESTYRRAQEDIQLLVQYLESIQVVAQEAQ